MCRKANRKSQSALLWYKIVKVLQSVCSPFKCLFFLVHYSFFLVLFLEGKGLDTKVTSIDVYIMLAEPNENVSPSMRTMYLFTSSCACARSSPGLCSPLIHSMVSNDSGRASKDPD